GPLEIHLVTDASGPATILIPAEDIVLSRTPMQSSARNQFRGRIISITERSNGNLSVAVDVGIEFVARITANAIEELNLKIGDSVVLFIKANAVQAF
ncbi:MAG: molybdopterin-binding protein, partial [Gemmatimonadales bacterium]